MTKKGEIDDMKKQIQSSHDSITEMKPTIERLQEIFKPEGQFDRFCDKVSDTHNKVNAHDKHISFLWIVTSGLIVTLLFFVIK